MTAPYFQTAAITLYQGDALDVLRQLPDESVHCVITSPPYYGLRDYGVAGAYGLESTPQELVRKLMTVFAEMRRVLRTDGVFWLNVGDSYAGGGNGGGGSFAQDGIRAAKPGSDKNVAARTGARGVGAPFKRKDLIGFSWMLAFALQANGWWLRSECVWHKPNAMPSSALDRPTVAHERVFLLTKSERYHYDAEAVRTPAKRPYTMKEPTGWDSDEGGHGTIHRNGRGRKDKQRGHSRRHDGFNDRWDAMSREEQMAMGANLRTVWEIPIQGFPGQHYATFPETLAETCIKAGCPDGGVVLDPFVGSGTSCRVAQRLGRRSIGIDLSASYLDMAIERCAQTALWFGTAPNSAYGRGK